jgi:cytochrome c biogenesis protein CcmG, thiol:disulfide interchange protein DsbE
VLQAGAVILLAALIGLFAKSVIDNQTSIAADVSDGGHPMAPDFTLQNVNGQGSTTLSSLRGKPVVLNFWASWCTPCKSEAAVLERDWTRYRSRGVVFLGVDYHDLAPDARSFVSAHELTFTMLQDGSGRVTGSYGISQVPETYVVSRQGRIVAHLAGPITDPSFAGEFRTALAKAAA